MKNNIMILIENTLSMLGFLIVASLNIGLFIVLPIVIIFALFN